MNEKTKISEGSQWQVPHILDTQSFIPYAGKKEELMAVIRKKTRKGTVYYMDIFRGYNFLGRLGKHHTVNHSKTLVVRRTKNHINGIEGFWSFAKHILYNYRGFPNITF